jgi:hypothetical protein
MRSAAIDTAILGVQTGYAKSCGDDPVPSPEFIKQALVNKSRSLTRSDPRSPCVH